MKQAIYVADLAAYNAGRLVGEWIRPYDYADPEELSEAAHSVVDPGGEEVAIHDYNDFPNLGEYPSWKEVWNVAQAVEDWGAWKVDAFLVSGIWQEDDSEGLCEAIEQSNRGEFDDLAEWAQEYYDSIGVDLGTLENYIDWERVGRDLAMDYTIIDLPRGVWIVDSRDLP